MSLGIPKYASVHEHLLTRISKMNLGEQLPTEAELCAEYDVSRVTIRRAVEELVRDGRLERQQGRGTFVVESHVPQQFREYFGDTIQGFFRQYEGQGRLVSSVVLRNEPTKEVAAAEALGLSPAEPLIELTRLRYVDQVLYQHATVWIAAARCPAVLDHDFSAGSLFDFLEEQGISLLRNDIIVTMAAVAGEVAEVFEIAPGEPVLVLRSVLFEADGRPVVYGITHNSPANSEILISVGTHSA